MPKIKTIRGIENRKVISQKRMSFAMNSSSTVFWSSARSAALRPMQRPAPWFTEYALFSAPNSAAMMTLPAVGLPGSRIG